MLKGKKILLGISGSIAAYKTPHLVRLLVKEGAFVKVVMTEAATTLVSPLALSTVSKQEVLTHISNDNEWNNHVHLAYWADVILVAPASANTLAKFAIGLCDNLLQAIYLSARSPIIIAPAMDSDMWIHPAVKENLKKLEQRNAYIIPVENGELASGLVGPGRMAEPEMIKQYLEDFFQNEKSDNEPRRKVVISAGPTHEMIDPVRYIGNSSSGKMGVAIANAFNRKNWDVTIVIGPGVNEQTINPSIKVTKIVSAEEMKREMVEHFADAAIAVMAAAVADFRPKIKAEEKIKKGASDEMSIELIKNPDILAHLGSIKKANQKVVGFALETNNEVANATLKLEKKNADFIALNSLKDEAVGFGKDTNKILLLRRNADPIDLGEGTKDELAEKLVAIIIN